MTVLLAGRLPEIVQEMFVMVVKFGREEGEKGKYM